jgi:hypothetical protein
MLGLRRVRNLIALTTAVCAAGVVLAAPASAAAGGSVLKDDIKLTIDRQGVLHVREAVDYNFGSGGSTAGMSRTLIDRLDYSDQYDREFLASTPKATSSDGGPTDVAVSKTADATVVNVGKGKQTSGTHTVVLDYTITGAVTPISGGEQVEWYAISGWTVPVTNAVVSVTGPSAMRSASCTAGAVNSSIYCTQSSMDHTMTTAVFRQVQLAPGQTLKVTVGLPPGTTNAKPILKAQWSLARAFDVNPVTVTVLVVLLILLLGGFTLLYYAHGRDKRAVRTKAEAGDHAPIVSANGDGLQFAPPNGVRPGQVGTLLDEQADVIDVTATIVDLAVRGYLLIEEMPHGRSARVDWKLVRKHAPVADLLPYERKLFDALFENRDSVKLSEIGRRDFSDKLAGVRDAMYRDVVRQGWFAHRPDSVRTRWTVTGLAVVVIGIVATVLLAIYSTYALAGLALIIAGAALAVGGQYMPAKTAKGATVLAHTIGFREYLYRADDVDNIPEPRRLELFSRYLPYAVVFDNVEQWDDILATHGDDVTAHTDNLAWYHGPAEWDMSNFGDSFQTFVITTSGAISGARQMRGMK